MHFYFWPLIQATAPLLTNDWQGVIKLALALGTVVLAILAALWKFIRSDLQEADKDLGRRIDDASRLLTFDINALGARVNEVQTSCTQNSTRTDEMRLNLDRAANKADNAIVGIQELRTELRGIREANIEAKTDIISHITAGQMAVMSATSATNERIAKAESAIEIMSRLVATKFPQDNSKRRE